MVTGDYLFRADALSISTFELTYEMYLKLGACPKFSAPNEVPNFGT